MGFSAQWRQGRAYWQRAWRAYVTDIRRLDAASRPTACAVVIVGVLSGLIPLGVFVTFFRVTDALVGARAVRVVTSDLHDALLTGAIVWLIATVAVLGREFVRGVAGRIAAHTAEIVLPASLLVCLAPLMPFRAVMGIAAVLVAEAWAQDRRVRLAATLCVTVVGLTAIATMVDYVTSRSVSVGGFLFFGSTIVGFVSWFIARRVATPPEYADHH